MLSDTGRMRVLLPLLLLSLMACTPPQPTLAPFLNLKQGDSVETVRAKLVGQGFAPLSIPLPEGVYGFSGPVFDVPSEVEVRINPQAPSTIVDVTVVPVPSVQVQEQVCETWQQGLTTLWQRRSEEVAGQMFYWTQEKASLDCGDLRHKVDISVTPLN